MADTMAGKGFRQLTKMSTLHKGVGKQPATLAGGGKSGRSIKSFAKTSARGGVETQVRESPRKRIRENSVEIVDTARATDISECHDRSSKKYKDKHHKKSAKLDLENLNLVEY